MKKFIKLIIIILAFILVLPNYVLPIISLSVYADNLNKYTSILKYDNTSNNISLGIGDKVIINDVNTYTCNQSELIDISLNGSELTITGKSIGNASISLNGGISEINVDITNESIYENPYSDAKSFDELADTDEKVMNIGDKIIIKSTGKTLSCNNLDFIKTSYSTFDYLVDTYFVIEITGYGKNTITLSDGATTKKIFIDSGLDTYFDQVYNSISKEGTIYCNISSQIPKGFTLITNNQSYDSIANYYTYNLKYQYSTLTGTETKEKEFNYTCYYKEQTDNYLSVSSNRYEVGNGTLDIKYHELDEVTDINSSDYLISVDDTSIMTVNNNLEYQALLPGTTKLHLVNKSTLKETIFDITVYTNETIDLTNKDAYFRELSSYSNTTQVVPYETDIKNSITNFFALVASKYGYKSPSISYNQSGGVYKITVKTGINNTNKTISNFTPNFYGATVKQENIYSKDTLNNYDISNIVTIKGISSPTYEFDYNHEMLSITNNKITALKNGESLLKIVVKDPTQNKTFNLETTLYINPSTIEQNELESKLSGMTKINLPISELEYNNDDELLKRLIKNEMLNQIGNIEIIKYLDMSVNKLIDNHVIVTFTSNKKNYNYNTSKQISYSFNTASSSLVYNYDDLLDNINEVSNLSLEDSIDIVSTSFSDSDITEKIKSKILDGTNYTAVFTLKEKNMVLDKIITNMIYHIKAYNNDYLLYEDDITINFNLIIPYNKRTDKIEEDYIKNYFTNMGKNVEVVEYANNVYKITENLNDYYIYLNKVGDNISGINISEDDINVYLNDYKQLNATVNPNNAYNTYLSYEVLDSNIADVTSNGLVSGKKIGTTTIMIKTIDPMIYKTVVVHVVDVLTTSISFEDKSINLLNGSIKDTHINVYPKNTTEINNFIYWSDDESVVRIENGLIKTIGVGSTYVHAKSSTGFYTDMLVNVENPIPDNSAIRFNVIGVINKIYNVKKQKQKIKVYLDGKKLKYKKDYIIKYVNNKNIGIATIKIIGINKYVDTKEISFRIRPKKIFVKQIKSNNNSIYIKWKGKSYATGYQVKYRLRNGEYTYTDLLSKKNKYIINDLNSDTKYDIKVRSYKIVNDTIIYGYWSKLRSKRTK